ncbi:MAG: CBS domain-containing protein [Candidatus Micrarchaeota archaeon]|nr:CBS domain-containing protein [Candidatus Micrarchaeota archaeon]
MINIFELEKIKSLRKKLDLTQKQLAKLAGVSQSLIAKIESNRVDPAYSKVIAIFQALEHELSKGDGAKKAKEIMTKHLLLAKPDDKLDKLMEIMREEGISQLPVIQNGKCIGSLSDGEFVDWLTKYGKNIGKVSAREVMEASFPSIPPEAELGVITELLRFYKAILVEEKGEIKGIITKADLIKTLKS